MANLDLGRLTGQQLPHNVNDQAKDNDTAEARKKEMEERQNWMLGQILDQEAFQRLQSMEPFKPVQISAVKEILLRMSANNQIRKRLTDDELKLLLRGVAAKDTNDTKVTTFRKKGIMDEEEEDDYDF
ncbi:Programmed cell death protein 5 [Coemansia guatemalensis]|uniref:Programmed cell death protein 5 n=1 Tax=Coemansia guatemalensis TaxID=2761395 RepID=A0A9W8HUG2_9FUNG|nr:Programmed cell death protein 5 [Coemansia guatemalensis]